MSKNNTITKSDKKFIRQEKSRIRATFLDVKKQQELINNLYKKFSAQPKAAPEVKAVEAKTETKEVKTETKKVKTPKVKNAKVAAKAKK